MPKEEQDTSQEAFDLEHFLPFILNQAAEATSKAFQPTYREAHGLTRTQWRVLAIVGRYTRLTARDICAIAHEEKSRVSRAVAALERHGLLRREDDSIDRRAENLSLTETGTGVYAELGRSALAFDEGLREALGPEAEAALRSLLERLTAIADKALDRPY